MKKETREQHWKKLIKLRKQRTNLKFNEEHFPWFSFLSLTSRNFSENIEVSCQHILASNNDETFHVQDSHPQAGLLIVKIKIICAWDKRVITSKENHLPWSRQFANFGISAKVVNCKFSTKTFHFNVDLNFQFLSTSENVHHIISIIEMFVIRNFPSPPFTKSFFLNA